MKTKFLLITTMVFLLFSCQQEEMETEQLSDCELEITNYTASMANPETGLIEGDIIPHPEVKGNVIKDMDRAWPFGVVPFYIDDLMDFRDYKEKALNTIEHFSDVTGLQWVEMNSIKAMKDTYGYGVHILPGLGSASVGRNPYGTQKMYFVFDPDSNATNLHEMAHTSGLEHEHNRHDRDEYIVMNWENINEGRQEDYKPKERSCDFGEYDYESITHYESNTGDKIIFTKTDGSLIEENQDLSAGDIEAIQVFNGLE